MDFKSRSKKCHKTNIIAKPTKKNQKILQPYQISKPDQTWNYKIPNNYQIQY
ncbi:hypothetical protein Hanom_Chr07g00663541 [Helianthus anomalus]